MPPTAFRRRLRPAPGGAERHPAVQKQRMGQDERCGLQLPRVEAARGLVDVPPAVGRPGQRAGHDVGHALRRRRRARRRLRREDRDPDVAVAPHARSLVPLEQRPVEGGRRLAFSAVAALPHRPAFAVPKRARAAGSADATAVAVTVAVAAVAVAAAAAAAVVLRQVAAPRQALAVGRRGRREGRRRRRVGRRGEAGRGRVGAAARLVPLRVHVAVRRPAAALLAAGGLVAQHERLHVPRQELVARPAVLHQGALVEALVLLIVHGVELVLLIARELVEVLAEWRAGRSRSSSTTTTTTRTTRRAVAAAAAALTAAALVGGRRLFGRRGASLEGPRRRRREQRLVQRRGGRGGGGSGAPPRQQCGGRFWLKWFVALPSPA